MSRQTDVVRRAVGALVASLLGAAMLAPTASPAAAAVPVPQTRAFSAYIDDYPSYETESTCSANEKPGVQRVRDLLRATYGTSIGANIVRSCTSSSSGHEEGRALDWMTNHRNATQREIARTFLAWLLAADESGNPHAMVRRMGIQYVIWNNRMWRAYDPYRGGSSGWTEYNGCQANSKKGKAYDTTCHRNHVHFSFSWDGAWARTSFFTGYVACPSFPTPGTAPALPTTGLEFVPLTPGRLLGTASGIGTPDGPCMVKPQTRFNLQVLDRAGLPATGVAAVVLRVGFYQPKQPTSLRVWPAGAQAPRNPVAFAKPGTAAGLVTVPVGYGGSVSLQHASGMSHLTADVVGYYRAPTTEGSLLHPLAPRAVVSNRTIAPGGSLTLDLESASGVPQLRAGLLSVTVSTPAAKGALKAHLPNRSLPNRSALGFAKGVVTTASVLAPTDSQGRAALHNTSAEPVTVEVDLQAVYADASVPGGRLFVPVRQARLVDTREDLGVSGPMTADRTVSFQVLGKGRVPTADVAAVVLNGSALNPTANTAGTFWTGGAGRPAVAQLRPQAARPGGDLMIVSPGASGMVAVRNASGTTDLTVDVAGYFR